jgi:D-inositol-3-phosphate glycosyltransferase
MNVYVRELCAALARSGVWCDVYTRANAPNLPPAVDVEPGLRVHHVAAGPPAPVPKETLFGHVEEFTEAVVDSLTVQADPDLPPADVIHANYWLSGISGHAIKHRLGLPLVSTFHTLERVKAEASPEEVEAAEPGRRANAEAEIIGCSDAMLASCEVEARQLVELYGASEERIEIVPLGVDHAFFSPGDRAQARRAVGVEVEGPLLLFVGRIQPLKGADVAVRVANLLGGVRLVIVGGPSGPHGPAELVSVRALVRELGLAGRVCFVPPQPHELLSSWYRAADVCLVPSRSESFGLVALEAAACGTPVVASAVGGLTAIVEHGRTGQLVEGRSAQGFAAATAALLDDPIGSLGVGLQAAERARRYSWKTAAARLRRLYGSLAERSLVEC